MAPTYVIFLSGTDEQRDASPLTARIATALRRGYGLPPESRGDSALSTMPHYALVVGRGRTSVRGGRTPAASEWSLGIE